MRYIVLIVMVGCILGMAVRDIYAWIREKNRK